MVIEVQTPNYHDPRKFEALGWTLLNLFRPNLDLNSGVFKLPLYEPPTDPQLPVNQILTSLVAISPYL
jgi:hypothetical protein